jgi:hypothetical protein
MFDKFECMYLEAPKPFNFTVTLSTRRIFKALVWTTGIDMNWWRYAVAMAVSTAILTLSFQVMTWELKYEDCCTGYHWPNSNK